MQATRPARTCLHIEAKPNWKPTHLVFRHAIGGVPARAGELDRLTSLVSTALGSQPSKPHAANQTMTLGRWIWQAAYEVAHLRP